MKLFDLLKSLNTGTAVNPDTLPTARAADRAQLLNELSALLKLLDAPKTPPIENASPISASLLNLDAIFEGAAVHEVVVHEAAAQENVVQENDVEKNGFHKIDSEQTAVLLFPSASTQPIDERSADDFQPAMHRQLVRSLLDELLPLLEKALGDRLDRLDNDTLQRWAKAAGQVTAPPEI